MSETIATASPANSLRRFVARVWDDPDNRSVTIGLLGVLLVHLLLFLTAPHLLRMEHVPSVLRPHSSSRQFNIEIAPDTFAIPKPAPKPPPPTRFVETNPDAPENIPDKTNNFAAQNQQVAQEKPTPNGTSDRPALEGKKDFDSTQIVSGRLQKLEEHLQPPPAPDAAPQQATTAVPRAEQNPLPGFEKTEGENKDAFGTNLAPSATNIRPIPQRIEGAKDAPLIEGAAQSQPAIDPKRPRPRPSIVKTQQVRPAILAENKFGTANIGPTAIDAKWSNYGEYLKRMIETVQIEWERMLVDQKTYPAAGSYVAVKFVLNSHGQIAKIVDVDNHSSDQGGRACVSGITNRAPYGEWTEDMIAVLGEEQEMTFTFYYQ